MVVNRGGKIPCTGQGDSCGVFSGVSTLSLDAKGRLAVPAKHRDALAESSGSRVFVTINPNKLERCLLLYPENEWREVARNLSRGAAMDPSIRAMQRLVIGHAAELEPDSQGRITLSSEQREFASLDKRVSLVGQTNKIEIWDEEALKGSREQWLDEVSSAEALEKLQGMML